MTGKLYGTLAANLVHKLLLVVHKLICHMTSFYSLAKHIDCFSSGEVEL